MAAYSIGDVARHSGFTTSSLRYYEGIGLLAPARRSDGGYRLYDDRTLERLAFIARAKALGCSLDQIADLLAVRDGDRCAPVQRRLHDLVTTKIADARRRSTELAAFTDQLRSAATRLGAPATDGPCDDTCACVVTSSAPDAPPVACTLEVSALGDRLAQWRRLAGGAARRTTTTNGVRLEFDGTAIMAELFRLTAAEHACCAFLGFVIAIKHGGITVEVTAPAEAAAQVAVLLGPAPEAEQRA